MLVPLAVLLVPLAVLLVPLQPVFLDFGVVFGDPFPPFAVVLVPFAALFGAILGELPKHAVETGVEVFLRHGRLADQLFQPLPETAVLLE